MVINIVHEVEKSVTRYTLNVERPLRVAIMGCEVNGPGEAKDADIGIAGGKASGLLFVKGKVVKKIKEKDFARELIAHILDKLEH